VEIIGDPFCGWGRTLNAAYRQGFVQLIGADIVDRGAADNVPGLRFREVDFFDNKIFDWFRNCGTIVANPPFGKRDNPEQLERIARRCLELAKRKVCLIFPTKRLNFAGAWLERTPLRRIWYMTPRPTMPPGWFLRKLIKQGKRPRSGLEDFCWLVWEHGYMGRPEARWLYRDGGGWNAAG
jgi:hypothetical protein